MGTPVFREKETIKPTHRDTIASKPSKISTPKRKIKKNVTIYELVEMRVVFNNCANNSAFTLSLRPNGVKITTNTPT